MKIRSKALWQYLSDRGALNGSEADIAIAKQLYRKEYKRNWKKNRLIKKRELRPGFTEKEYRHLVAKAQEAGYTPTGYIKTLALNSLSNQELIPHREKLQKILQFLGMAINSMPSAFPEYLLVSEAEMLLLQYLGKDVDLFDFPIRNSN